MFGMLKLKEWTTFAGAALAGGVLAWLITEELPFQLEHHYGTSGGKPNCGYNSSNGCCGLPAQGGNCDVTKLNFQSLGTNNPCPGCYSQPNGGRHHCCPDKPPYNGGGPCVCAGKQYTGGAAATTPAAGG
jgi:hypothetical protein